MLVSSIAARQIVLKVENYSTYINTVYAQTQSGLVLNFIKNDHCHVGTK